MFGGLGATQIIILIVSLVVSMVIHEFMHGFAAFKLGDDTAMEHGRLSFNPLHHIDPFMTIALPVITTLIPPHAPILAAKPVPFNPSRLKYDDYGAGMVAAAGPISNIALAAVAVLVLQLFGPQGFAANAIGTFATINVLLFVFNLVPIPPLDGSRVLYTFAPDAVRELFDQIEPFGFFIILALLYFNGFNFLLNIDQMVINLLNKI